jgi:N-acetyl-anhydromuramoyl-L-alanine amidase
MRFAEFTRPSPHFSATPANERLGVLFHHSVMSFDDTIALMCEGPREISYHCLIAADGRRCTLVADAHLAWHAGASSFRGRSRCNDFLLGVAFAGDTYANPLTDEQLASAIEWLEARWEIYGWRPDRMTDHRQVAPGRKDDLNPAEWEHLRRRIEERFGAAE